MALNQFTNQLGYFQANLETQFDHNPTSQNTFDDLRITWTDQPEYQYNTSLGSRGEVQLKVRGIWKIDMVGTWQGATNDNLVLRAKIGQGSSYNSYPPVKWNGRGGNNWAISYSTLIEVKSDEDVIVFQLKNEDDTAQCSLMLGILTAVKLY